MANTPCGTVRVDPVLVDTARERLGDPDLSFAVLARVGICVLAGLPMPEALARAQSPRRGPKPKARTAA
jgi:hypothetical protein